MVLENLPTTPQRKPSYTLDDVNSIISESARKVGVSPSYMKAMAQQESSRNPMAMAPTSSAKGLFQFIDSTWEDTVNKHGKKHGLTLDIADPYNPQHNALMGAEFAKDNQKALNKAGIKNPTNTDLYLMHFMGSGGGRKFLTALEKSPKAKASKLFPRAAKSNPWVFKDRSVEEVYKFFDKKMKKNTEPEAPQRKPEPSKSMNSFERLIIEVLKGM